MKISMLHLLYFLATPYLLMAVEPSRDRQAQAKHATLFVEAQQFESARAIYESLINTNPEPWEEAILHYNLASIDLAEGRWLQALREFDAIKVSEAPSWLIGRLETNRAIALIGRINEILTHILPETNQPNEALDQLQQLVTQAHHALIDAQVANCQTVESANCFLPPDLTEFQLMLKNLEIEIEGQFESQRVTNLSPVELIGTLTASLKSDRRQINVLPEGALHAFLTSRAAEQASYWNALRAQLAVPSKPEISIQQANSPKAAVAAIDEAIATLETLFKALVPLNPPVMQGIARLRFDYAELLGAELSLAAIQSIQESYRQLTTGAPADIVERLISAQTAHQYGTRALLQDDPAMARVFFSVASLWADLAMQAMPSPNSKSPSIWLKALISLQDAVNITTRKAEGLIVTSSTFTDELQQVLNQIQQAALRLSHSFQTSVLTQEKNRYADGECQASPWKQVLPDFFEGHAEIATAAHDLAQTLPNWRVIRESQQRGISLWRRAWNRLEQPPEDTPQAEVQPEELQEKQLPFSETIRLLQQMESDDRPERSSSNRNRGVSRPW